MNLLRLPSKFKDATILEFARLRDDHKCDRGLQIDFGEERFVSPFAMLFIAAKLRSFQKNNPEIKFDFANYSNHNYLSHMGFFKMFGVDHGRDVGEAWGGRTYLKITCVERAELYESPTDKYEELPDLIQRRADALSLIIARDRWENKQLFDFYHIQLGRSCVTCLSIVAQTPFSTALNIGRRVTRSNLQLRISELELEKA